MRIVAVADTHTFEADLREIPAGDVFVHAGDLLRAGTLAELAGVAAWLHALPHPHKLVVAGNHDLCFVHDHEAACALLGPTVRYLQDDGLTIDGARFWGSPWQPAYHDWAFNLDRGAPLAEKWALIPEGTDVLITHGPPRGRGDRGPFPGRHGCDDLAERVARIRPALHLFGHIHQDGGCWRDGPVFSVNVTTWECERAPTVIDFDPRSRAVTPVEIPPAGR
jgi:Icc-related predicted phosphoesterase